MMYKNSFKKTGLTFLVFILFIGLSVIPGYSSSVSSINKAEIEQEIERDVSFSWNRWMEIEDITGYPGEPLIIPIYGGWVDPIYSFEIGLYYPDDIIETIDVQQAGISQDAIVFNYVTYDLPMSCFLGIYALILPPIPPGTGILVELVIKISEDAMTGDYLLILGHYGGPPEVHCHYNNIPLDINALIDGTLTVLEPTCADMNGDGNGPDIADLVYLVDYMFQGGDPPIPDPCVADVNGDGNGPDIADLVYLVDYMFTGGPSIVDDCCG